MNISGDVPAFLQDKFEQSSHPFVFGYCEIARRSSLLLKGVTLKHAYRKHHHALALATACSAVADKQHRDLSPFVTMISRFTKLFFCVVLALVRLLY